MYLLVFFSYGLYISFDLCRRKSRTQLEFLPRAVHRTREIQDQVSESKMDTGTIDPQSSTVTGSKDNEYFRRLLK